MTTNHRLSGTIFFGCLLTASACSTPQSPEETAEGAEAVTLTTRDDITLSGDHYPAASGSPGLVLLHMNPAAGNDRTNWPATFIDQLHAHDWHLLVIDRRGTGLSEGEAQDAFEGEKGRYDVEAAALYLQSSGAGSLVIVAASNGTTSLLDYALWAPGEGLPQPVVAALLTGGSYTENQNSFADFPAIPSLFSYASDEAEWSNAQQEANPGPWVFQEYADGAHGTHLFEAAPSLGDDIEAFLVDSL
jgi:pimeloyl-ACP methyl ester carboxylesterase